MKNNQFELTRKFWSEEIIRGNLEWPDENVIRFVKRNFKQNSTILDFGCGAGRNAIALAKDGYEVIAMDYTEAALKKVKENSKLLNIDIKKNYDVDIPLKENSIDAVVACGSMFYHNKEETLKLLTSIKMVLKDKGKFWADWRTKEDWLFLHTIQIDECLYALDDSSQRKNATYSFFEENELREMYE